MSPVLATDNDVIYNVAYFHNPPFAFRDKNNQVAGIMAELLALALEENNARFKAHYFPLARFMKAVEEGENSHVQFLPKNLADLDKVLLYGEQEIFRYALNVYSRKESTLSALSGLEGKTIALIKDYQYPSLTKQKRELIYQGRVRYLSNNFSALKMLQTKRLDYVLSYDFLLNEEIEEIGDEWLDYYTVVYMSYYVSVHKTAPNAKALIKALDSTFKRWIESGRVKTIVDGHLSQSN